MLSKKLKKYKSIHLNFSYLKQGNYEPCFFNVSKENDVKEQIRSNVKVFMKILFVSDNKNIKVFTDEAKLKKLILKK